MKALEDGVRAIEMDGLVWGLSKVSLLAPATNERRAEFIMAACSCRLRCQQAPDQLGCRRREGFHRCPPGTDPGARGLRSGGSHTSN